MGRKRKGDSTMHRMKKGAIELPFHWIFVLIAGFVILAFFFSIALKVRKASEQKLEAELASTMDAIFNLALQSPGTLQNITIPRKGLLISCTAPPGCDCNFKVGKRSVGYKDKIVFATDALLGKKGFFWTLEWKYPFHSTNFLYSTNEEIRYNIVYTGEEKQLKQELEKTLLGELNVKFYDNKDLKEIPWEGEQHTRFVFIGELKGYELHKSFKKRSVDAVEISNNQIIYFEKEKEILKKIREIAIPSNDVPVILGAIFSSGEEMFLCNMASAFEKERHVSEVFRIALNEINVEDRCLYFKSEGNEALKDIGDSALLASDYYLNPQQSVISQVEDAKKQVEALNNKLLKDGCPTLY